MQIYANSLEELWVAAASDVLFNGQRHAPRGLATREVIGAQLVLTDPRNRIPKLPVREFSLAYAMGELAWYLCSDDTVEFIKHYAPSYGKYSDDGKRLHGAYGPRIFGTEQDAHTGEPRSQWSDCINILKADPDSRQAVISIYRPSDCGAKTKDMPCTLSLQFLLRNGHLDMITTMRSNDLWFGGVYDLFCFTALQELMANALSKPGALVGLGYYYHNVGSLHLYERNAEAISNCLQQYHVPPDANSHNMRNGHIQRGQTIEELLHNEKCIRLSDPITALEELCASLEAPYAPTLWDLGYAAWRWKIVNSSVHIKEEQRRYVRGMLQDRLGSTFDRCFF